MLRRRGLRLLLLASVASLAAMAFGATACDSFGGASEVPDGATDVQVTTDGASDDAASGACWALAFDGVDDYVQVADDPELDPKGPSTVEAWVRYDKDEESEMQVVSHHNHDQTTGYVLMIYGYGTIAMDGGPAELGATARYYENGNLWQAGFALGSHVIRGEWTHIAMVYDGSGSVRPYVNGDPKTPRTGTKNPANADNDGPLRIGSSSQGAGGFFFPGLIDEVRISSSARYSGARFKPTRRWTSDAETIALYHFDEGQGVVASSATGRHDGQIKGAAWTKIPCDP